MSDERLARDELPDLSGLIGVSRSGRVVGVTGTVVRAAVPDVRIGELCRIQRGPGQIDLEAEVIGFNREEVLLMPFGRMESIASGAVVVPSAAVAKIAAGDAVRGRVLDALGRPIDGRGELCVHERVPMIAPSPDPLTRARITEALSTGVPAIDALLTVGVGQRVGIFAAAGVGKSTLLSMIARHVEADTVVLALIGERGREVRGFLEDDLGPDGLANATVVVSTSDQSALMRLKAAYTATAIAEAARARGERVVLMMDSVTRFARALREVGLAAGEPPGRQGYPASVFATLPQLFERAGNDARGSITAFYTVLVEGDDMNEPVADETRSLLDGHIVLASKIQKRGRYPAIDVPASKSRLIRNLASKEHLAAAERVVKILELYEVNYDKITMGLYDPPAAEKALIDRHEDVLEFVYRGGASAPLATSVAELVRGFRR